jgi:hypothetical protein
MVRAMFRARHRLIGLFAVVFVGGCAASAPSVTPVVGPEGQSGYLQVSCPGDHHKCPELAAQWCPGGYNIEDFKIGSAGSRYDAPDSLDENFGSPERRNNWLITCRDGKP